VVFPLFVERTLDGNDAAFTAMFSVLSFGSVVGALMTARRSAVTVDHVLWSAAAFGASMSVFAFAPTLTWTFPLGLVVGGASVAFLTSSTSIVQLRADPSMRGRVLALQAMVFLGSTPIGGPIIGAVCDAFGARVGVLVGGAAALAAAAWGRAAFARVAVPIPS
jgi:MFS family permease